MSLDLLNELEKRVQSAVDTIDSLKDEVELLKLENAQLQEEKDAWESRLAGLLGKFSLLDSVATPAAVTEDASEADLLAEDESADDVEEEQMLADESVAEEQLVEEDLNDLDELELATQPTSSSFTPPQF